MQKRLIFLLFFILAITHPFAFNSLAAQEPAQSFFNYNKGLSILGKDKEAYTIGFSSSSKESKPAAARSETLPEKQITPASTAPSDALTPTAVQPPVAVLPPTPAERAGKELLDYLHDQGVFYYSPDRWKKMRQDKEKKAESLFDGINLSTAPRPVAQPQPIPEGLYVELPYESQLSIAGRKTIGVSCSL